MRIMETERCNHPSWACEKTIFGDVCRICNPKPNEDDRTFL